MLQYEISLNSWHHRVQYPRAWAMSSYMPKKSLSRSIHFSCPKCFWFGRLWRVFITVLLIGPNVKIWFNLELNIVASHLHLRSCHLGKWSWIHYNIFHWFGLKGTTVHSREFSISSCFRTWHEKSWYRYVANILSPPLSDLSLSTLRQGTSHPLCYTPAGKNQWACKCVFGKIMKKGDLVEVEHQV